jgi:Flp pilus assembly pilin Flp
MGENANERHTSEDVPEIPGPEGQDLVEYALLVALVALVCVTGVNNVATAVNSVFTNISSSLA